MPISPEDYQWMVEYKSEITELLCRFDKRLPDEGLAFVKELAYNNEFHIAFEILMWRIIDSWCEITKYEYKRIHELSDGMIEDQKIVDDFDAYFSLQFEQ